MIPLVLDNEQSNLLNSQDDLSGFSTIIYAVLIVIIIAIAIGVVLKFKSTEDKK